MRSVYIHIPFCKTICSYCDFPKQVYNEGFALDYLDSLEKEVNEFYENDPVKAIYIGGGTPSVLSIEYLNKLFKIISKIDIISGAEFTFEMNIDDVDEEKILFLKSHHVNRISLGVQSLNKKKQEFLNRKHKKKEVIEKINLIKRLGIDNINIDLMYAIPNETLFNLKKDVKSFIKIGVPHISTYSLIIEEHTRIKVEGVVPISEDLDAKMYNYICKKLKKRNYNHYEVSNFALPGYESKHNLNYWDNNEYYGFGLGAHGFVNGVRYANTKNFTSYINEDYRLEELYLSKREDMENEIMLGLRKLKGLNIKTFYKKYGINIQDEFNLVPLVKDKLLVLDDDGYLKIPEEKIYIMNEIIAKIF